MEKFEEKFRNPRFCCDHGSIHQYKDIYRDINVLLIGQCGAGKSATGNTLLGKDIFEESDTDAPETKSVKFATIQEGTFNITVFDTPGIQNENFPLNVVEEMITFKGGIHLFLVVCKGNADQEITEVISTIFAENACDQCIVILTDARSRFVGKKKMIMRDYIQLQKDRGGPLADLFQLVQDRVIAVENCFDEDDDMMIDQQRQTLLCCLAQVIKDNKGLVYSKELLQNAKTRIKKDEALKDMNRRLREYLIQTYLETLSEQQLENIQATLDGNVKDIMQACQVMDFCPSITEGDAMQYMRLFIQENKREISEVKKELYHKIRTEERRQIKIWKAFEEKFYCISCKCDNIESYTDVPKDINVLLIGKTGSGKSATGNTIVGKSSFKESGSSDSVTKTIRMETMTESGFNITVIDTPGLFDTAKDFKNEDLVLEIAKTMINFKGEIHLFLLVLGSVSRFTKEEQDTIKAIEKVLGKNIYKNCVLVLTYARAKFGSEDKKSLQQYVESEKNSGREFADLLKKINYRIIAVENFFDDDFLIRKHRQKFLCCLAQILHDIKGTVFSHKGFEKAKARVDQQEQERKNRLARETELTLMKKQLQKCIQQKYLKPLTEDKLDSIREQVLKEIELIKHKSGVAQLEYITPEDVKTYVQTFIEENNELIERLENVRKQEKIQKLKHEQTVQRLKYEEEINKMQTIVLALVSNFLRRQSTQQLEDINEMKELPCGFTDDIIANLESEDVHVNMELTKSFIQETYFKNPTQIQAYIDDKVLTEKLEENSKQLQKLQREQKLNDIMGILKENLNKILETKDEKELMRLRTDLENIDNLGPGNWESLLTELVESKIKDFDQSSIEVTNLFLKQNKTWIRGILGILFDKKRKQNEAKRLLEMEEIRNHAFNIISTVIKEKLKPYLTNKTITELATLEAQIDRGEVPSNIFKQVFAKLTSAQQNILSENEIKAEILKQIKEQNETIEEFKKAAGECFAGSTKVIIKERGIAKISNVRVDDDILVFDENGHLYYDKVYLISHAREDENITFVHLQTSSDKNLHISPGHLLPVGSLGSNVAAKDVSLGNVIFTLQDGVMMPDKVTSVTYELCRGAYCPMTMDGTIVVNDVAASCYTTFFPSPLAHALLSPIRLFFSYLPLPLFNRLLPYDTEEGMPLLLLKCRSIIIMWRSLYTRNSYPSG